MTKSPAGICDPSARPLPPGLIGKRVKVHLNLHNKCYVITVGGKVQGYTQAVVLADATTAVSRSGYESCKTEQSRNVHAYLLGTLTEAGVVHEAPPGWLRLSYNCLQGPMCFTYRDGTDAGECFVSASQVLALPSGRVWVAPAPARPARPAFESQAAAVRSFVAAVRSRA